MYEPSFTEKFASDRLESNFRDVLAANELLERKAVWVLGASTGLAGLVTSLNFLPKTGVEVGSASGVCLFIGCVCAAMVVFRAGRTWNPTKYVIPGTTDPKDLFSTYIGDDPSVVFSRSIVDLANAVDAATRVNNSKAGELESMTRWLGGQLVALALAILLS